MLSVGSVFAGYTVERVLGAGGMGVVYLARNPDLPRSEAVKVLSAELSRDPNFRARFVREADVAAGLDHPNIVSVHRRGEFEGQLWIAMQFVDGTDADGAQQAGSMTPARAVHIVTEVAKALDYAHRRDVVHRDIKPANFLLSGPVGCDERVLLGDFGIARALGDTRLTATGSVLATLSYVAPEVLAGDAFGGRADLYSLGCSLFRLLTGKAPFWSADGMAAVMAAHLHQPPPRVTDQVPGLPAGLDAVIAAAMAKNPAQRFSSGRELAEAAAQALQHGAPGPTVALTQPTVQVPPPPQWWHQPTAPATVLASSPGHRLPPGPPGKRRGRGRIAAALAAVVVVVVATATALTLTSRHTAPPAGPVASPSTTTPPPPSTVAVTALPDLLLRTDKIAEIMGFPKMVVNNTGGQFNDNSGDIEEKDCVSAWMPAQRAEYVDVGATRVQQQVVIPVEGAGAMVLQAVIAFPDADAALTLLRNQRSRWSACAGRTVTMNVPNQPAQHYTFGTLTKVDDVTVALPEDRGDGWTCQRALTARENLAIDILACRIDVANRGVEILNAVAAKIPQ